MRVRAPCSSANLGPGYDLLGIALNAFQDIVEVELVSGEGEARVVEVTGPYSNSVPLGRSNSAAEAAIATLRFAEQRLDAKIRIWKGVPPGRGLGSSGVSAAAAAKAVNEMLGGVLTEEELVKAASEGERMSSGYPHSDNVAPSLLGGLVILSSRITVFKPDLNFVLVIPWIEVPESKTKFMREVLPNQVPFEQFLKHCSHLTHLLLGLAKGDAKLLGEGMNYSLIDEVRSRFIPGFSELKSEALKRGALGVSISGAGPSILILCEECEELREAMRGKCRELGIPASVLRVSTADGASII